MMAKLKENFDQRKSIVQQIMQKSTDFLRRIIVLAEGQGGVRLSYVCPHCHRYPIGIQWVSTERGDSGKKNKHCCTFVNVGVQLSRLLLLLLYHHHHSAHSRKNHQCAIASAAHVRYQLSRVAVLCDLWEDECLHPRRRPRYRARTEGPIPSRLEPCGSCRCSSTSFECGVRASCEHCLRQAPN